jgi:hypothetical protein
VLHRRAAALAKCALVAADEGRAIPCEAAPHFSQRERISSAIRSLWSCPG